jgi:hypothetical protein
MRSAIALLTMLAALGACSSPYSYTDQVQTFNKGTTALSTADTETAKRTVVAQHLYNRLKWTRDRTALRPSPGCDIDAAGAEVCEPIPVNTVVAAAPNRVEPSRAPIPDVCAAIPAPSGTHAPKQKLPASVDRATMSKAVKNYGAALAALTNAKDRTDFDSASAKVAAALGDLAKAAGPEGAAFGPAVKASANLLLWIVGQELDYRRFKELQIATAAACQPIHIIADALGVGKEEDHARELDALQGVMIIRVQNVNRLRTNTTATDQAYSIAIEDAYAAADTFQSARKSDPWSATQALRKAHDDLFMAVNFGSVDLAVVEKSVQDLEQRATDLRTAVQAASGKKS